MESHETKDPGRDWGSKVACCKACGISVYADKSDAEATKKRIPALRAMEIAVAKISEESGVLAPTPSNQAQSHCTWWIDPDLSDAHTLLEVE